jgi:CBS domain-containing protein
MTGATTRPVTDPEAKPGPEKGVRRAAGDPVATQVEFAARLVRSAMSRPVLAITSDASLDRALELLTATTLRHLAVVDEERRCVGVLADRALAAAWARDPADFGRHLVREVLAPELPLVPATFTVGAAAQLMLRRGTDALVVVDRDRRVLGILTATDLVGLVAEAVPGRPVPGGTQD